MKSVILLFMIISFSKYLSAQDSYLILSRERHRSVTPSTLAEVPIAIAFEIIDKKLPPPKPVIRKIREGANLKVISNDGTGKVKSKGKLDILNDSIVNVGASDILITDIDKIRVRSLFSKVSGPVFACAGAAGTIVTVPLFIESLTLINGGLLEALGSIILIPLAGAAVVGCAAVSVWGIVYFINGRVFNTYKNKLRTEYLWQIKVAGYYSVKSPGS